jgi:hypothetical protein
VPALVGGTLRRGVLQLEFGAAVAWTGLGSTDAFELEVRASGRPAGDRPARE